MIRERGLRDIDDARWWLYSSIYRTGRRLLSKCSKMPYRRRFTLMLRRRHRWRRGYRRPPSPAGGITEMMPLGNNGILDARAIYHYDENHYGGGANSRDIGG